MCEMTSNQPNASSSASAGVCPCQQSTLPMPTMVPRKREHVSPKNTCKFHVKRVHVSPTMVPRKREHVSPKKYLQNGTIGHSARLAPGLRTIGHAARLAPGLGTSGHSAKNTPPRPCAGLQSLHRRNLHHAPSSSSVKLSLSTAEAQDTARGRCELDITYRHAKGPTPKSFKWTSHRTDASKWTMICNDAPGPAQTIQRNCTRCRGVLVATWRCRA